MAKLSIVPLQRGYCGNKIDKLHTIPCKVIGRCSSVLVCLIPAPRGTDIVSAPVPEKLLLRAGVDDCCTFQPEAALPPWATSPRPPLIIYSYLTPDPWKETIFPIRSSLTILRKPTPESLCTKTPAKL
jgi:small subunit ribosomal protein S2e